ncbi:lectin subunit alpha-like [Lucilia sericata]|uniref:lectin subunit alpha-like n=1 Tax=Lucilia sericata TaxID=13632 RepID=UPI0018A857EE|nr:lectin subunit alpha-like [Lucilia sericata]
MSTAIYFIVIAKFLIFYIFHISAYGHLYTSDANKTYYIDFERKYSWFEGQIYCTQMGMTLVELNTQTKNLEVYRLIKHVQNRYNIEGSFLWIGGILDRFPNRRFAWLSTGEYFTYTDWYGDNPDYYYNNEFCVELEMKENWRWSDDSCITRGGFICEHKKETEIRQKLEENLQEVNKQKVEIQKELQKQKDLQQRYQQQLQQSREEINNLIKQNDNLQKNLKKLEDNLQIEIKKQQNLEQTPQKPNSESTNPFESSLLSNHIKEALRTDKELKDNSNKLIKSDVRINGGNNIIVYYSPYYGFLTIRSLTIPNSLIDRVVIRIKIIRFIWKNMIFLRRNEKFEI